ncbi:hypothetical protein J3R30DRAFT_3610850 [Lentinula aciculospora]|uniref:Uncharacterized protein n=1 Tax=Lentinula aciculospora TaxID=153920 RepID=A0A9W8ZSK4_9AGAR|nr:hypothetical protein J3R30DRAFT_3610850 [Lentinula aciculospora]
MRTDGEHSPFEEVNSVVNYEFGQPQNFVTIQQFLDDDNNRTSRLQCIVQGYMFEINWAANDHIFSLDVAVGYWKQTPSGLEFDMKLEEILSLDKEPATDVHGNPPAEVNTSATATGEGAGKRSRQAESREVKLGSPGAEHGKDSLNIGREGADIAQDTQIFDEKANETAVENKT